jgi:hypothetical protein
MPRASIKTISLYKVTIVYTHVLNLRVLLVK